MADADLFENWFSIADQDHDGLLTGAEAVQFFQRSNLSQETLFQVATAFHPRHGSCHVRVTVPHIQWRSFLEGVSKHADGLTCLL